MRRVGVIANPVSGHDVRRISALASTRSNLEKVQLLARVLRGMAGVGVGEVVLFPDSLGITRAAAELAPGIAVRMLEAELVASPTDTLSGAARLADEVDVIVALGGDGTQRLVAESAPDVALLPLAGGTNNAFGFEAEGTLAGMAVGYLVQDERLWDGLRRVKRAHVEVDGAPAGAALADAVVLRRAFVGAGALTDVAQFAEAVLPFAAPGNLGVTSVAGLVHPVGRHEPNGIHLVFGGERTVRAAIAPGRVEAVPLISLAPVSLGERVTFAPLDGVLALDGEALMHFSRDQRIEASVACDGPFLVDPHAVLEVRRAKFEG
jgi:hypothetical protein